MKTNFKLVLLMAMLLAGYSGRSQCSGNLSSVQWAGGYGQYYLNQYDSLMTATIHWDFGDGTILDDSLSYNSQPWASHTFTYSGTFIVCATLTSTQPACVFTACDTVQINLCHGVSGFISTPTGFGNYVFADTAFPYTPHLAIHWDFGDGTSYDSCSAPHHYNANGTYTVCCYATDTVRGCADTTCKQISVNICSIGSTYAYSSNSSTTIPFAVTNPYGAYGYSWNFGDGTSATGTNVTHTFPSAASYTVCLLTTDTAAGCSDTICNSVAAGYCGLNGTFNSYDNGMGNVSFFSNSIVDSFNAPLSIVWDFGDGSTSTGTGNDSILNTSHWYRQSGSYSACVTISTLNSTCSYTTCDSININICHGIANYYISQTGFGDYTFAQYYSYDSMTGLLWDFGDGNTSSSHFPSHHYSANGAYSVCLYLNDTARGCSDTYCQQLGVNLCSFASSIMYDSSNYGLHNGNSFVVANPVPGYNYTWNFGDGTTGAGDTVIHNYSQIGFYTFCLITSDPNTGCSDSTCVSQQIDPCNIYGSVSQSVNGPIAAFSAYGSPAYTYTYAWSFAGATPSASNTASPTVTYGQTGTYQACLILSNQNGCADTICQSVVISSLTAHYSLGGRVVKNNGSACANVYLIKQDTIGHLVLIDSVQTSDTVGYSCIGYYNFNNLPADTYYVKAAPDINDPDSAVFLPTYYGDVLNWANATSVDLTSTSTVNINIALVPGNNPGGPGFVSGFVSQGAGLALPNLGPIITRGSTPNLAHAQINLLTINDSPVAYTYSDAAGYFSFSNLALGSYKIYAEILSKPALPDTFTLTADNPTDTAISITATGITRTDDLRITAVYPNPVSTKLQIEVASRQPGSATLRLFDILGNEIVVQKINPVSGVNKTELNMEQVAPGVYDLTLLSDKGKTTFKIIKTK